MLKVFAWEGSSKHYKKSLFSPEVITPNYSFFHGATACRNFEVRDIPRLFVIVGLFGVAMVACVFELDRLVFVVVVSDLWLRVVVAGGSVDIPKQNTNGMKYFIPDWSINKD